MNNFLQQHLIFILGTLSLVGFVVVTNQSQNTPIQTVTATTTPSTTTVSTEQQEPATPVSQNTDTSAPVTKVVQKIPVAQQTTTVAPVVKPAVTVTSRVPRRFGDDDSGGDD